MSAAFSNSLLRNSSRIRHSCHLYLNRLKASKPIKPSKPSENPTSDYITMHDVKKQLKKLMGIKLLYSPHLQTEREHLLEYLPKSQDELPPRTMQDSFSEVYVPLETDYVLRDKYVTFKGHVRLGRLMEDMDMFAVYVAENHILNPKQKPDVPTPYVLVTILVERITIQDVQIMPHGNIRLSGHVSWVGRSSMEIVVWLEQYLDKEWKKITRALFLMAARNSTNTASAPVNRITPGSEYEKEILAGGKERDARRKIIRSESLLRQLPDDCEQSVIHKMFLDTLDYSNAFFLAQKKPRNSKWMSQINLSNIIFCQPQHRNLHNKIFGGYLMRMALELSWMEAYMYSSHLPTLLLMADITFQQPVDVGSLLKMQAVVTYTEQRYMTVLVFAQIMDPQGKLSTSNNFHYIFSSPEEVKRVIPKTYAESMLYIEGRRKFQYLLSLKN